MLRKDDVTRFTQGDVPCAETMGPILSNPLWEVIGTMRYDIRLQRNGLSS
jgi:hypothetical protein